MRPPTRAFLILALLASSVAASSDGPCPIVDAHRRPLPGAEEGMQRWLVAFRTGPDLDAYREAREQGRTDLGEVVAELQRRADALRKGFRADVEQLGGRVLRNYWLVPGSLIEIPEPRLGALRRLPGLLFVEPDAEARPSAPIRVSTNQDNHRVDEVHALGVRGKGSCLAILDSGLDADMNGSGRPHTVFYQDGNTQAGGPGIRGSRLLQNVGLGLLGPEDPNGHGTAVAAVAIGARWNQTAEADDGQAPRAFLAGFGLSNDAKGTSSSAVIVLAWQRVLQDRNRLGIQVANFSYTGSENPIAFSQQALDNVALVGDVLPVVAASNSGPSSVGSPSCANGLAVGAVDKSTAGPESGKIVAPFSAIGPLAGARQRFYPDLTAVGVDVRTARADQESTHFTDSGTSYAAPQVAGSALLFRSLVPGASAKLTKAVILATTEDISDRNQSAPRNTRMAFGVGYLRTDRVVAAARGSALLVEGTIDTKNPVLRRETTIEQGQRYGVAIAWQRTDLTAPAWNDVDLRILQNKQVIASASAPENLYEALRFEAKISGKITIEAVATRWSGSSTKTELALAFVPIGRVEQTGIAQPYGLACPGSPISQREIAVLPRAAKSKFGGASTNFVFGFEPHVYQQVHAASEVPAAFTCHGIAFRESSIGRAWNTTYQVDMEVWVGDAKRPPATMSSVAAENRGTVFQKVLSKRRLSLPTLRGFSKDPDSWAIRIPFDRPYVWSGYGNLPLLIECKQSWASTTHPFGVDYDIDAWFDPGFSVSRLVTPLRSSSQPVLGLGRGAVIRILETNLFGKLPKIRTPEPPRIGATQIFEIEDGLASSTAVAFVGWSRTSWGSLPLPFDLSPLGAPGCTLWTGYEVQLRPILLDAEGAGQVPVPIPNAVPLVGAKFHAQALVLDGAANAMGLSFTGALALQIGG